MVEKRRKRRQSKATQVKKERSRRCFTRIRKNIMSPAQCFDAITPPRDAGGVMESVENRARRFYRSAQDRPAA